MHRESGSPETARTASGLSISSTGSRAKSSLQTNPLETSFGQIQAANDPRIIQLALKVIF